MRDPLTAARDFGVPVELADLGDWGVATLVAEYDPAGPIIRINSRAIPAGSPGAIREHVAAAVAHELYHHREALGAIARLPSREARERAAGEGR